MQNQKKVIPQVAKCSFERETEGCSSEKCIIQFDLYVNATAQNDIYFIKCAFNNTFVYALPFYEVYISNHTVYINVLKLSIIVAHNMLSILLLKNKRIGFTFQVEHLTVTST